MSPTGIPANPYRNNPIPLDKRDPYGEPTNANHPINPRSNRTRIALDRSGPSVKKGGRGHDWYKND